MRKLKTTEVATTRSSLLVAQGNLCAICKLKCKNPVLDHDHSTGLIRAALCAGCNSLLGKLENNHRRYGVQSLPAFCHGVPSYLQRHETDQTGLLHPTHKTADEKRVALNTKARKKRAALKGTA